MRGPNIISLLYLIRKVFFMQIIIVNLFIVNYFELKNIENEN